MSIVTLKRKTNATYRVLSGKSPEAIMVTRGPGQKVPLSRGGGFSLNGKHRNIGRVGKNSLFSVTGSKAKPGTSDLRGWGGCCGTYYNKPVNVSWKNNLCCVANEGVKPSTLNTKGMLSMKYKWKKTIAPAKDFVSQGKEVPANNQIETIYNRWVGTDDTSNYVIKNSSQIYTENKSAVNSQCVQNKKTGGDKTCFLKDKSCGYHIGGKYYIPTPYAKFLNRIGDSRRAINNAKEKRAPLFPKGYNRPYPFSTSKMECFEFSRQATDPRILNTYYFDQNNTSNKKC